MDNLVAHGLIQHMNEEIEFAESEYRKIWKQEFKDSATFMLLGRMKGEIEAMKRVQRKIAFDLLMIERGAEFKTTKIENLEYYAERR